MVVLLRYKLATHTCNKQMSKLSFVSLLQIFSAMFLPNIISIGLTAGKVITKIKGVNFLLRHNVQYSYIKDAGC